jgi:ubiquinone/menaquinone biosynthesis C-methylase UbiE
MAVLLGGFASTQMLYVAARLRLADHLAKGPLALSELATESGAREEPLGRVVRALAAFGVFAVAEGKVSNTPLSECLRGVGHESMRDLALLYGEEHYHAMSELLQAVKRGGSAFEHAYRKPHFSYLASNPDAAQAYYETSSASLARTARSLAREYDFSQATRVVDVGGGNGHLLRAILMANPSINGVIVDSAGMTAKARSRIHADGLDERCEIETGDILSAVPHGDVYLLGQVLHGMDDEQATCVLRACTRTASPGARVLIIERLIPDARTAAVDAQFVALSDIVGLAVSGGRERTLDEVTALLESSGLELERVLAMSSGDSVVEAELTP